MIHLTLIKMPDQQSQGAIWLIIARLNAHLLNLKLWLSVLELVISKPSFKHGIALLRLVFWSYMTSTLPTQHKKYVLKTLNFLFFLGF